MAGIFLVVALSSLGLPALNGFVGEFLVLLGTYYEYGYWVVPAAFGIVLAAIYLLWAYQRVFHGEPAGENRTLPDLSRRELATLLPILVLIVFIGVYPKPFLERIEPAAQRAVLQLRNCSVEPGLRSGEAGAVSNESRCPSRSRGADGVAEAP